MTLATPSALRILLIFGLLIIFGSERPAFAQGSGSVVTINADKVLVINGRKTFPITLSPGPGNYSRTPAGIDALAELRDAGALIVRMAQTTDWNDQVIADQQATLDWAAQRGMYCMVNLRERSEFAAGDSATESALRSLVNRFKDHPALAIWKNQDEAWWGNVPVANLRRGYDVIKTEDPNHPIEQTHAPRGTLEDLQPYNDAADILAIDIYPVSIPPGTHSLLANKEISMIGDWTRFLGEVTAGQKQYWMVEQIAWSGVTPPRPLIFPTFAQSRFMAYQAIINGARGLMFFGGNVASALNEQDAPLGWNWTFWDEVLRRVVEEIGDHSILTNALVAPNSALSLGMSGATAAELEFVVREAGPYLYILACKREGTPKTVTFSGLPAWAATAEVLYESGRTLTASEGRFSDTFHPFDVHVYRFSQNSQGPTILHPPQARDNHPGTPAVFRVFADGTAPLSYHWRKNGTELSDTETMSGTKSPVLILSKVAPADAGSYDVLVRGTGNVISPAATLNVIEYGPNQLPVLAAQPQNQTRYIGETALLRVVVNGTGPFAYQWRKNGTELSNGGNVAGATSWRLRLSNVSPVDTGDYDVVVSGAAQVTSAPAARLTVIPQPEHVLLYEPFDYSNVGEAVTNNTPGNWAFGGTGANDLNVVAENLSYDGLASPHGRSVANGGVGQGVRRLFGAAVADGQLFFSALFRINDLGSAWNGAPSQAGAFAATDNVSFRLAVMVRSAPAGTYLVGVQKGGSGATPTFAPNPRAPGETLFLVGKYDFSVSPNTVSLWINPAAETFGGISAPANGYIAAESGVDGFAIDRFNMRQNTATSVPAAMQWDELRVGTSWADVTPPPLPLPAQLTRLDNGKFQFDYLNRSARGYTVYATSNFMDWTAIGSGSLIGPGLYRFVDQEASAHSRRFYQLRSP